MNNVRLLRRTPLPLVLAAALAAAAPLRAQSERQPAASEGSAASLAAAVAARNAASAGLALSDGARGAIQTLVEDARAALAASPIPAGRTLTVLPLAGDAGDYVRTRLQAAVTEAGRSYVVGELDPILQAVAAEFALQERRDDIYDPGFLAAITNRTLKAEQVILYGTVRIEEKAGGRGAFGQLVLHALDLATKEQLWARVFACNHYLPGDAFFEGCSSLPALYRQAIREDVLAKLTAALQPLAGRPGIRRIAFLPLAADDDGYVTQIVNEALVANGLSPINDGLSTPADALAQLDRDNRPGRADALLYGSLRDMGVLRRHGLDDAPWRPAVEIELQADVLLAGTHEIVWAGTVAARSPVPLTWWQALNLRVGYFAPFLEGRLGWIPVALVALVALALFLRAATRVR